MHNICKAMRWTLYFVIWLFNFEVLCACFLFVKSVDKLVTKTREDMLYGNEVELFELIVKRNT